MICRHCGKEYADDMGYCPYCAEPIRQADRSLEENYIWKKTMPWLLFMIIFCAVLQIFLLIALNIIGLLIGMVMCPLMIWATWYGFRKRAIEDLKKNSRKTIIEKQFLADKTSICPNCGSHDIKVYRKGYNYRPGFWGAIFGVRGAGYVGGFDANNACCRCMNCGNDWETDYDYRLINK